MRAWGLSTSLLSTGVQNFSISPGKPFPTLTFPRKSHFDVTGLDALQNKPFKSV
jgi:hypothetical protein